MSEERGRVLVSGASVAGLTVAWWLDRYGFEVTVVERAPGLRPGGQALDVRGPALEVARRMGVLEQFRKRTTELRGMSMVDNSGAEIYRTTERTLTGGRLDSEDLEVLRDDLVDVLHGACGPGVRFVFDDRIAALEQDGSGVDVRFEKAAPERYDVVIGADGAHSGTRKLVFGPEKPFLRYMGGYVAVMTIPNFLGLDRWQTFLMAGDAAGAGLIGLDGGSEARAYLGFESEEPVEYDYRDETAQKRLIAERAGGLGWVVPRILQHMRDDATGFHFDARIQVIMEHWTKGRVALVGDAGYAVSLTTGQGASMAMAGAYVLAGEIAAAADPATGIARYEDEIRDYVLRNQAAARQLNDQNHSDEEPAGPGDFADFGALVEALTLKDYRTAADS
ncbi:FAD-dependent monooxygenase [Actinoplanes sp. LDG1-06]|uniref:FAD-dependent monooxygenase n=1 Tax=Paractinoplanes ovalisporus TaxID=2810368 RepID=A0ABS2AHV2_9ACTN|nr:FAD-dependent monooxygenase [Actinoplanes ovalisporus]MBM2619390.1 FAD-dependent monooxygenase [Actinoplanes ovalisporus]